MVGEVSFPKQFQFHPKQKREDPGPVSSLERWLYPPLRPPLGGMRAYEGVLAAGPLKVNRQSPALRTPPPVNLASAPSAFHLTG